MVKKLISTDPSRNFEMLGEVEVSSLSEVKAAVRRARLAQPAWHGGGRA